MKDLFNKISSFFNSIRSNIAFYPTILAALGFTVSLVMKLLEQQGISKYLLNLLPQLVVEDGDTALTILSVCIGGLISLMVFSFSMVMLLLSQASSNYSPRLLPGLISDKRHQIILGIYLATIMYNIFTLFSIAPSGEKYALPGFSILLGIIFTIVCLCSFIYFIHNMSESIQISNILDNIHDKATSRLKTILKKEKEIDSNDDVGDSNTWNGYGATQNGYFQNLSASNILEFCQENDCKVHIKIPKGLFVRKNDIMFLSDRELNEKQQKTVNSNFNFSKSELVRDNYSLAFKQITEIAVKAMSPGINDPGTAINAIDYLTGLFQLRMLKKDVDIFVDDKGNPRFKLEIIQFNDLIYNVMASLRTYCKHDPVLVQKLLGMLDYLSEQEAFEPRYKEAIKYETELLRKDSKEILEELKTRK